MTSFFTCRYCDRRWATDNKQMAGRRSCAPCEDSVFFLDAYEAGVLDAVRADVARYVEECEREAKEALSHAYVLQCTIDNASGLYAEACAEMEDEVRFMRSKIELLEVQATDCRKWLEMTQ